MRRQTYGYLPSRRASPPHDRYQVIPLDDRGTCVWTCPRESGTAEIRTRDLSSRKSNALTTTPPRHTTRHYAISELAITGCRCLCLFLCLSQVVVLSKRWKDQAKIFLDRCHRPPSSKVWLFCDRSCPFVRPFHSVFWMNGSLTSTCCVCMGRDHSSPGIKSRGHRVEVGFILARTVKRSVWTYGTTRDLRAIQTDRQADTLITIPYGAD